MYSKSFLLYAILGVSLFGCSQKKPKLVVGITVDQMRYDYLTRFSEKFKNNGFKKLINEGHHLQNVHYNYMPTYTAVGHASIFTGTTPEYHGIIGNSWYDKFEKEFIYCVNDDRYHTLGGKSKQGKSPHRMHVSSIMDQLRLAQNLKGKTIGISIKDRSAILPAGHMATAAYWFEGKALGNFVSSNFYFPLENRLPQWVQNFNRAKKASSYLSKSWETLYPIATYTESRADNNPYEELFKGEEKPVFPHNFKNNEDYDRIKSTPFGNDLLLDFAKATITGEKLGTTNYTDFLSISFSSTDYVGHMYGPYSKEIEDTYIRLDKNIADLIVFLDEKVGRNNYTLFLTADHAVVPVPSFLASLKIPAGYIHRKDLRRWLEKKVTEKFGTSDLIENISNFQIFLNREKIKKLGIGFRKVQDFLVDMLLNIEDKNLGKIHSAISAYSLRNNEFRHGIFGAMQRGYHSRFSGDVLFAYAPNFFETSKEAAAMEQGTTHGTAYNYDTHVPVLFYGLGIKKGTTKKRYNITDVAPTIGNLLQISLPSGCSGRIISEALKDE